MSSAVKAQKNQTGHRTKAELAAREEAEASVKTERPAELKAPKNFPKPARKYWNSIIKRLQDVELLGELDKEMFAVYCQMLVRRDDLNTLCDKLLANAIEQDGESENAKATDKLDSLLAKVAALERNLMSYADKLGFTPHCRVRLAQKRASAAAEDSDAGFFGD